MAVTLTCVGGGPTGSSTANLLNLFGHSAHVVTRAAAPAAWLAESIPASAASVIANAGLEEAIGTAGFQRNGGNTVWWAERPERSEHFGEGVSGVHVERGALERAMHAALVDAGVRIDRSTVRSVERTAGGWRVRTSEEEIETGWVIDATGRGGVVARRGRIEDRPTGTLALCGWWQRPGGWEEEDRTHTLIESYADGWAWSVPISNDVRCVTAMVDPRETDLERTGDLDAMLHRELAKAPNLSTRLEGTMYRGKAKACPASLYTNERFAGDGYLLVGDAGSFIDPLSSYGVKKALASGWLAAVTLHTVITDESMTSVALDFFDAREKEVYRRYRELSIPFFEEAAGEYGTPFWEQRAEAARRAAGVTRGSTFDGAPIDPADRVDPAQDADALLGHRDVREAYEELRRRPDIDLAPGQSLERVDRPLIRENRIVLEAHLKSASVGEGVRFVRNVDLVRVVDAAEGKDQVPDVFEAYMRGGRTAALPDFLAALAVCVGKGFLELPDWRPTSWRRTIQE